MSVHVVYLVVASRSHAQKFAQNPVKFIVLLYSYCR
jgi:hypothetical protein